ncbi:P-loop containing nucleoside triphosphate hydrolases superfamily protein [Actinidia rufa]|uniref:Kinesin-like protein n=1 Tax=Actinidia rufa TaxID=165716 RepID=A0A7J0H049_9ERIC|nr:P-loop containing nucleoside triphosphate hydrolases superfamily protein [Actinidia rufa]
MNPHLEVYASENGQPNNLSDAHNGGGVEEVSLLKLGGYANLPAAKISEMMKRKNLENSSIQSLFSVANKVLDDCIERNNGEIPHCMAFLLKKVMQEIEERVSTQAESFRKQNNFCKVLEEKYQSKIRVLETLTIGTSEENEIEKTEIEEKKKVEEQDVVRLMKEKDHSDRQISALKQELEMAKNTYEKQCVQLETQAKETKIKLEKKLMELEGLLTDSRNRVKELEVFSESKMLRWREKELSYKRILDSQFQSLQELRVASKFIKRGVLKTQRAYSEEFNHMGLKLKELMDAAKNYHTVLAENRKLYNEVQDLKGNIRVYCRIRPFLPGQNQNRTTIEYIGENGELDVVNPLKQGKDSHRLFKFNRVFSPAATQGATALNERSSRSHRFLDDIVVYFQFIEKGVLTVHIRGLDLETRAVLRGSLHLVDLAGSERVDRSEATGDRLREAQHINKSLSALGDVIFALAQKSPHVPYRNSKLTQVLQSSLGGQAKTLMFVQLNPDVESYFETISTLKFAERVSGVELGAARRNKEGRGLRELMEQVALLKDTMAKKDEEIGRLQLLKSSVNGERRSMSSPRYGSSSPRNSVGAPQQSRTLSGGKSSRPAEKTVSDMDNSSDYSDRHSEVGSQHSMDEFRHHKEFFRQSRLAVADGETSLTENIESRLALVDVSQNIMDDELLGFGDGNPEERLSDISDGELSMGTETDGSMNSIVEFTLFPETAKPPIDSTKKPTVPAKLPRPPQKQGQKGSSRLSLTRGSAKVSSSI